MSAAECRVLHTNGAGLTSYRKCAMGGMFSLSTFIHLLDKSTSLDFLLFMLLNCSHVNCHGNH